MDKCAKGENFKKEKWVKFSSVPKLLYTTLAMQNEFKARINIHPFKKSHDKLKTMYRN